MGWWLRNCGGGDGGLGFHQHGLAGTELANGELSIDP
jgi:hypothetical protein